MSSLSSLRNIGVCAHIDAGKTTVTERILHLCGVEHRVGRVDEGTAAMDWMPEERERGITITSAATRVSWRGSEINIIDTPGHVDFTVEVERCMRVLDGAVLVIDAVAGVQAQSETVWRQMKRHNVPCLCFVNKCDKAGADLLAAARSVRERLGARAVPFAYPLEEEGQVVGVIDLLRSQALRFDAAGRAVPAEPSAEQLEEALVLRAELIDTLAEEDEGLLEAVLEERDPPPAELLVAARRRVLAGDLVPVFCGSALRGIGIPPLLDGVVDLLPSPLDRPAPQGFDPEGEPLQGPGPKEDAHPLALAFKIHSSPHGDLTFARVYAGTLTPGMKLWNPRTRSMERPGRILRMHADHGEALEEAGPGEIVALVGCKAIATGDTLCDRAEPILLEPPTFPEPVIALVAEPASSSDRDKLRAALERLAREDPSFRVSEDASSGQWTIEGMGELHLEVALHRLRGEFGVEARVGKPRVSYREAITGPGRGSGQVDRLLGGREVFGGVSLTVEPGEGGVEVLWEEESAQLPANLRQAVTSALQNEALSGPRLGYPLDSVRIRVTGVQRHPEREAEAGYALAATLALREALGEAPSCLLEPRMRVEVQAPEEFASGIIADLGARHAEVGEVKSEGNLRTVTATVPLAQMFGYSTVVRSLSQGRASWSMTPAGFVVVPEGELAGRGLL